MFSIQDNPLEEKSLSVVSTTLSEIVVEDVQHGIISDKGKPPQEMCTYVEDLLVNFRPSSQQKESIFHDMLRILRQTRTEDARLTYAEFIYHYFSTRDQRYALYQSLLGYLTTDSANFCKFMYTHYGVFKRDILSALYTHVMSDEPVSIGKICWLAQQTENQDVRKVDVIDKVLSLLSDSQDAEILMNTFSIIMFLNDITANLKPFLKIKLAQQIDPSVWKRLGERFRWDKFFNILKKTREKQCVFSGMTKMDKIEIPLTTCVICHDMPFQAITTGCKNHHIGCADCILEKVWHNGACPICQQKTVWSAVKAVEVRIPGI